MKNSLKEVIEGIQDLVENNIPELKRVDYTFDFSQDVEKAKDFPALFIVSNQNFTIGENTNNVPLLLVFCDVAGGRLTDAEKDKEIKSDMIQAASKLFDLMQADSYFNGEVSVNAQPFSYGLNNALSGIDCIVDISIEKPCYNV